jgi:hypothetical protein
MSGDFWKRDRNTINRGTEDIDAVIQRVQEQSSLQITSRLTLLRKELLDRTETDIQDLRHTLAAFKR